MSVTLAMIRTFVSVAENGSIMLASEQLGRTPSAVSMALKQLEIEIGTPLFQGERKGNLTPTGLFALEQTRNLMDHCDEILSSIASFSRNEIGYLSLACVPSVAEQILPSVIKVFHKQSPKVEIEIRDADSRSVINAVHSGRVQFGIASLAKSLPGMEFIPLFEDSLGVVCSNEDLPTKIDKNMSSKLLKKKKLLANSITQSLKAQDLLTNMGTSSITVHNVTSVLALVKAGTGVTILPRLSVPSADKLLQFIPLDTPQMRQVGLVKLKNNTLSPAAIALINLIQDRVTEIELSMEGNFKKLKVKVP
ncbi:MAG: LysR substrate-binding domain-containing protein [Halopseudomonas aestusnigri]